MIGRFWTTLARPFRRTPRPPPRYAVVMTTQCRDQLTEKLRGSVRRGHEGIVYFVGLTTGSTLAGPVRNGPRGGCDGRKRRRIRS